MRKIKWGVLGTAGIAKSCTIPGMKLANNCELYAIAGRDEEKTNSFKLEFGFDKAYYDYDNLLNDAEVEALYIPLPNDLHYDWVIKALNKGKHVLCEKPMGISKEQTQEMFELAKANNVHLMEAFAYLHSPYIKAVKDEINAGTIGDITYIETAFLTSDYDISNIRMRKECFGGCLYDLGVYCTSLIQYMKDDEAIADIKAVSTFSEEGIDTHTLAILEYESGKKASFSTGMVLETGKDRRIDRFEIQGTKGSIKGEIFEFNLSGEMTYIINKFDEKEEVKYEVKKIIAPQNYMLEVEQFGRCISDGEKPFVTEEFSVKNAELIDRILDVINYRK